MRLQGPKARPIALLAITLLLLLIPTLQAQTVLRLTLHDTIQPITADYLTRGLRAAADQHANAVLISLGTPGGLLDSTRTMVAAIEQSPVPVIVYISPPGSRAGSAGFFLLEAADIAAMAPGTNAGAAHPILGPGNEQGKQLDPILKEKIENDTAAFLRSYVSRRGRNTQAAEDAVRNSKSYSDTEALQLHLIDLTAPDDAALLAALDGRSIHRFEGQAVTLHLARARIVPLPPSTRERLLSALTRPDLAVFLMVIGGLLIYLEFNVPGTIVPGAVGTLLLLLGLFGLNLLPVRHTAIALLVAAFVLILLEAKFTSHGILALAGTLALVFGLATLVDGPIPELRVHTPLAVAAGLGFGIISFTLAWIALRARRNKVLLGPQAMIGGLAICRTPLNPTGQIEIRGELWQATLNPSPSSLEASALASPEVPASPILPLANPPSTPPALPEGASVRIRAVRGLTLIVEAAASR